MAFLSPFSIFWQSPIRRTVRQCFGCLYLLSATIFRKVPHRNVFGGSCEIGTERFENILETFLKIVIRFLDLILAYLKHISGLMNLIWELIFLESGSNF